MFVNPTTPENPMHHRRTLTKGQQVALGGLGDMFSDFRDTVTAPAKALVIVPITATAGLISGGWQGAKTGAQGGILYTAGPVLAPIVRPIIGVRPPKRFDPVSPVTGDFPVPGDINECPRGTAYPRIALEPGKRWSCAGGGAPHVIIDPNYISYVADPVLMNPPEIIVPPAGNKPIVPSANSIIGQASADNQASYGQMPYVPASPPGYDENGNALPPPKKDIPWAAIATGSMAAVTLISALMNKHSAHTG